MMNRFKESEKQWRTSQQINLKASYKSSQIDQNFIMPCIPNGEKQNQKNAKNMISINFNNIKEKTLISPKTNQNIEKIALQTNPMNRKSTQMANKSRNKVQNIMTERNQTQVNCLNHQTRKAEFLVLIEENEQNYYCGRCAAHYASQGCAVHKIEVYKGVMKMSKRNQLPQLIQYQDEPIYQQIKQVVKLCNRVVLEHNANIQTFSSLDNIYQDQIDLTTSFYDRLIEIVQEMKRDHLADLETERDKYNQIADIQNGHLRQNIIQINVIKNDIQDNLQQVLQGIRETQDCSQCRESLDHYRQKLTLFRHQTEQQIDSLEEVTSYSQLKIDKMIHSFESFLQDMWEDGDSKLEYEDHISCSNQPLKNGMTVKNIHQILPQGVSYDNCEAKKAFRNLEDDEDGNLPERKSPNFKRI